jgi:hypothetical protein
MQGIPLRAINHDLSEYKIQNVWMALLMPSWAFQQREFENGKKNEHVAFWWSEKETGKKIFYCGDKLYEIIHLF